MKTRRSLPLLGAFLASASLAAAGDLVAGGRFTWSTESTEARALLGLLQSRIESFQFGPGNVELAQKIVAADPGFAMGHYYLGSLDQHVIVSRAFAQAAGAAARSRLVSLGRYAMKGVARPQELYTLDPG